MLPGEVRTRLIERGTAPPPVFVDASGRRRRRLRRLGYALCAAALLLVAVLWVSQAGDQVRPEPVFPCPSATAPAKTTAPPAPPCGVPR